MIFYFTGTGNSKYIASKLAETLDAGIINIAECIKNGSYTFDMKDHKFSGFVYPVYYYGIPMIMRDFLGRLKIENGENTYSFSIANCASNTGRAGSQFKKLYPVNGYYGITAVDNYLPFSGAPDKDKIEKVLDETDQILDNISGKIKSGFTGEYDNYKNIWGTALGFAAYPLYLNGRKTEKFSADAGCTGCGLCEKTCPAEAVRIKNRKPEWIKPQCELCMGCINRCPAGCIEYGKSTKGKKRYVNPRIKQPLF